MRAKYGQGAVDSLDDYATRGEAEPVYEVSQDPAAVREMRIAVS